MEDWVGRSRGVTDCLVGIFANLVNVKMRMGFGVEVFWSVYVVEQKKVQEI